MTAKHGLDGHLMISQNPFLQSNTLFFSFEFIAQSNKKLNQKQPILKINRIKQLSIFDWDQHS